MYDKWELFIGELRDIGNNIVIVLINKVRRERERERGREFVKNEY